MDENEAAPAFIQPGEIAKLLAPLDVRERELLKLRFGLDRGEPRTLQEVADIFHITPKRVRQIEGQAMNKLRGDRPPPPPMSRKELADLLRLSSQRKPEREMMPPTKASKSWSPQRLERERAQRQRVIDARVAAGEGYCHETTVFGTQCMNVVLDPDVVICNFHRIWKSRAR